MMKKLAILLLLSLSTTIALSSRSRGAESPETPPVESIAAYIDDDSGNATNFRDKPKGQVIGQLPITYTVALTITHPIQGWWQVLQGEVYPEEESQADALPLSSFIHHKVWIHYSVLCCGTRNYGGERWALRVSPTEKAKETFVFTQEVTLRPIDMKGEWVKVVTTDGQHTGWIERDRLCGNPLTNCC